VTYLVDVVITSENKAKLLTGMRADVSFTSEFVKNALLCPNEAVREGPRGKLGVYIPKTDSAPGEHETQFVDVRFGLDNGNYSEVLDGLDEGTLVYIKLPAKTDSSKDKKRT
jgi:multidrug efflux pump subunit AcrA (membrane-fusion protein)